MSALFWVTMLLGCVASVEDLRRRAIANWIPVAGLIAGLACHAGAKGWAGLLESLGGAAAGFAVFLIFYLLRAMGAADVKLMAAFGALLGPSGILLAALLAAPVGALIAAGCLLGSWRVRAIPYAPAISLGAWLALLGKG